MSKSRYIPYKRSSSWIRNHSHRTLRRVTQEWLHKIRVGKSEYEESAEPSEVLRKKIFIDWYW